MREEVEPEREYSKHLQNDSNLGSPQPQTPGIQRPNGVPTKEGQIHDIEARILGLPQRKRLPKVSFTTERVAALD